MGILHDGKLWPCNAGASWRDESDMLTRWIGLPNGPWMERCLAQWHRLARRDKGWRQYTGATRSPRCVAHVGRQGWGGTPC